MKGLLKRAAAVLVGWQSALMNLSACSASEDTANAPKIATEGNAGRMSIHPDGPFSRRSASLSISEEQLTIQKGIYESQGSARGDHCADRHLKEAKSEYGTIHGWIRRTPRWYCFRIRPIPWLWA